MLGRGVHQVLFFFLLVIITMVSPPASSRAGCPDFLEDRADVTDNPPGMDYDVYYTNDNFSSYDYFDALRAKIVRDSLVSAHNIFIGPGYNFHSPNFGDPTNDVCIYNIFNVGEVSPNWIHLDSYSLLELSKEPAIRNAVGHELFHTVQFSYIDYYKQSSWGLWAVEGSARAMEDKIWLDNDASSKNTSYVRDVGIYLNNPNQNLFDASYRAALFWTYLSEQLGDSSLAEPGRGVDFIRRFWANAEGKKPDGVECLRETIDQFSPGTTLENLFIDFCIANYTHHINVDLLSEPDRFRYFDESSDGGGAFYAKVATSYPAAWNTTDNAEVSPWGALYFEKDVPSEKRCEAVGFWGKAKNNVNLAWALIAMTNRNEWRVEGVYIGSGSEVHRAVLNPPQGYYHRIGLVVIGLNQGGEFEYALGWGPVTGEIRRPTADWTARVGQRGDPERFQVRMNIVGPESLTPTGVGPVSVKGFDPSDFKVDLLSSSTGTAYQAEVINGLYVGGEYWLTVQAPEITDPADGDRYDLRVCFCNLEGSCENNLISPRSVLYADVTVNMMLTLDRSGSMLMPLTAPKILAARNAARLYVDSAGHDDFLGLVAFNGDGQECNDDATVNWDLQTAASNRSGLINAINAIDCRGMTSIGDGLRASWRQLAAIDSPADINSIVLLSDGLENEEDFWAEENPVCQTDPVRMEFDPSTGRAGGVRVDTVAFGPVTKEELLQNMADFTGGDFYPVSLSSPASRQTAGEKNRARTGAGDEINPADLEVPNRLANIFKSIEEEVSHKQRLFQQVARVTAGVPVSLDIVVTEDVGGGATDAAFAFNWDADTAVTVILTDPDGQRITEAADGWTLVSDRTNTVFHYAHALAAGQWRAEIQSDRDVQLLAMLSGKLVKGVRLEMYFSQVDAHACARDDDPLSKYLRGLPVGIFANLHDGAGGVGGLDLTASIENPDGSVNHLTLFDDGRHDDGTAGDGVYGNLYTRTPFYSSGEQTPETMGSYAVTVKAGGADNLGQRFKRYRTKGFHVFEYADPIMLDWCNPDRDGDGLPDRWEDLNGLDKDEPGDAVFDYDHDGLDNTGEFENGCLPYNPDTDGGGEADGSETAAGRDPLYEKDDLLPPLVDYGLVRERCCLPVHLPQANTNILHFQVNPAYRFIQIWRTGPSGRAFSLAARVDLEVDSSGIYYDRGLENGKIYRYYLMAEGESNAVTPRTRIFSGTPKADPLPPKGWIKINHGASRTDSVNVLVQLDTSDESIEAVLAGDPGFDGARWEGLKSETSFALIPPEGETDQFIAAVYARFRDPAGNESMIYGDAIFVDRFGDFDGDGLNNSLDADDDNDGLYDLEEITVGSPACASDPFDADTDRDGLPDGDEDCDRDLLGKLYELRHGLDPERNLADINLDGVCDQTDRDLFDSCYTARDPRADVNQDGAIDEEDQRLFELAYENERSYHGGSIPDPREVYSGLAAVLSLLLD